MTPQERDLITALLGRLQQQSGAPKDAEAEALIRRGTAQIPDAAYLLVQAVLIEDMALHEAQNRIAALEGAPHGQANEAAPPSFLPRGQGAGQGEQSGAVQAQNPSGSVPNAGPLAAPPPASSPPQRPVWTQSFAPPQPAPPPGPPGGSAYGFAPPYANAPPYAYGPQFLAGSDSGFLRQAAATAAGLVGGSLLFEGISSMFGPHYGGGFLGGMSTQPGLSETVINNYYNDQPASDAAKNDADDRNTLPADDNGAQNQGQDFSDDDMGSDPGGDFSNDGGYDV